MAENSERGVARKKRMERLDMSEQPESESTTAADPSAEMTNTEQNGHMIPKARFDEVNDKMKSLQVQMDKMAASQQKEEEQRLAAQNEWQTLAEKKTAEVDDLATYKTRWEQLETELMAENKKRIEEVPEEKRSLIPDYSDPTKLSSWLNANAAILTGSQGSPNLNAGEGGKPRGKVLGSQVTHDDIRAAKMNSGAYRR